ncbi:mitogen-activated protein kinase kinase kinase 1-like [Papaver somniferum]|uniref:mitogen-activated protein kinase kinase kinase 1-like n=1 Tax=Papaver somniferum TaxID=3469 RepID=UPI000E70084D|nr:mitogen-activated protein kinase kinase kinase 1-like [Papaver somniferum]
MQNRSDAQKVLTKSWIQINRNLLVGVKPVDPIQRKMLNEPTQQVADRIQKALQERLCLLHRCESDFFLLGATGDVYNVRLSTTSLCSCPDRQSPCEHILFVFLRVLEVSLNDPCVWRKTLREFQLTRLLNTPTSPQILAGSRVRERFLHLFSNKSDLGPPPKPELGKCVKCRREMYAEDRVSDCGAGVCDPVGHVKCMIYRKPSGAPFCAGCGSRWNEDQEK